MTAVDGVMQRRPPLAIAHPHLTLVRPQGHFDRRRIAAPRRGVDRPCSVDVVAPPIVGEQLRYRFMAPIARDDHQILVPVAHPRGVVTPVQQ